MRTRLQGQLANPQSALLTGFVTDNIQLGRQPNVQIVPLGSGAADGGDGPGTFHVTVRGPALPPLPATDCLQQCSCALSRPHSSLRRSTTRSPRM